MPSREYEVASARNRIIVAIAKANIPADLEELAAIWDVYDKEIASAYQAASIDMSTARHMEVPYTKYGGEVIQVCRWCGEPWPCTDFGVLAEVGRLQQQNRELKETLAGHAWKCTLCGATAGQEQ